jgi:hypothetical protein
VISATRRQWLHGKIWNCFEKIQKTRSH